MPIFGDRKATSVWFLLLCTCAASLLGISACRQQAPGTRAADELAVKNTDAAWSKAAATHDVEKTVAYYSDDAVLLPPNERIVQGKQAIRASWVALLAPSNAVSWQANRVDVSASGDLAYLVGTYELKIADSKGKAVTDHGKTMEIFKKQADGAWKVVADMYSSDLPAPPA